MNHTIILFGGSSGERLVSVASAQNIVENFNFNEIIFLDQLGQVYRVSKSELLEHQNPFLKQFEPKSEALYKSLTEAIGFLQNKTVFLALHGTEGEDGKIQSLFEKNKIYFTGSGSVASHNAFDKKKSKDIVSKSEINVTAELILFKKEFESQKQNLFSFFNTHKKIVLKPVANGSSIGLYIIDNEQALSAAFDRLKENSFGDYIAEKFIQGRELTVGVYHSAKGLIALPPSEVLVNAGRSFDYEGKYLGSGTQEITPAKLSESEIQLVQQVALKSHQALNCFGYTRTDLILTSAGPVYLETNTLPGLSRPSFFPQQLSVADLKFSDFIERQIHLAEKR